MNNCQGPVISWADLTRGAAAARDKPAVMAENNRIAIRERGTVMRGLLRIAGRPATARGRPPGFVGRNFVDKIRYAL
jgi:hypothetical protein